METLGDKKTSKNEQNEQIDFCEDCMKPLTIEEFKEMRNVNVLL